MLEIEDQVTGLSLMRESVLEYGSHDLAMKNIGQGKKAQQWPYRPQKRSLSWALDPQCTNVTDV